MYCTTKTLKFLLYLLNIFCAILGAVLIWIGVWLLHSSEDIERDHGENLAATLIIVLGTVILVTTSFGCVADFMESKSMLTLYAVVLVVLLVVQLILVSVSYTASAGGQSADLTRGFEELWDKTEHINSTLSYYEEWLGCCGKNSAEDYILLDKMLPSSCCKDRDCTNVFNLYVVGCEQKYKEYVQAKTGNFNILSWLLIIIEFTSSVIACVLVDSIRNHRDRRRFYS